MIAIDINRPKRGYMPKAKSDEWGTPKAFFDELDKEFHFTMDVCASKENHKCQYYFDKEMDGLKQEWHGVAFCNPPYGAKEIEQWIKKAFHEAKVRGTTTVMLVPNTTDVGWFHKYIYSYKRDSFVGDECSVFCRFVKGRINFDPPPGQKSISNVKGSMVIIIKPIVPSLHDCPPPEAFKNIINSYDPMYITPPPDLSKFLADSDQEDWRSKFESLSLKHEKLRGFVKELGRNVDGLNKNISSALDFI